MRTKIIAGNLIAVLLVGLVSYFVVSTQLEATFVSDLEAQVERDDDLFEQSFRLSGMELLDRTAALASAEESRHPFLGLDEDAQRDRAHARANAVAAEMLRQNRDGGPAEIVVVTNADGAIIARNQDRIRMFGEPLARELPSLARVLASGEPAIDVWKFTAAGQARPLQTAMAPIRDAEGATIGALVVGFDISNGMAERMSEMLGRDVAFVSEDGVFAHSLDTAIVPELRGALFEAHEAETQAALRGTDARPHWIVSLGGDEYSAVTGTLPNASSTHVAYVVLANRTEAAGKGTAVIAILVMMGLGLVIVLVYGFLVGSSFLKPIEQLEEGVLAVINGKTDQRIEVESAELGGLAYRINQLLNVFTGTPEEDEQGRVSGAPDWSGDASAADGKSTPPPGPAQSEEPDDPALAEKLASEPAEAYYDRIYTEYVAAKEALGENVSNITKDRFIQRLQANEASLQKKHGCRMVRFQVQSKGAQVNLRPVIIR
jgi:hypothetical protein